MVFISHFGIKEGALDDMKRLSADVFERLRGEKPRTVLFLAYLDEEGTEVSFLHAFPDAEAMDIHFEGVDERVAGRVSVPGASGMGDLRATQRGSPGVRCAKRLRARGSR